MPKSPTPSLDRLTATKLIRRQLEEADRIKLLGFEHPDVYKWETDTAAVLERTVGSTLANEFDALGQTEEFSKYAEMWMEETEGDDVKHARLCEKRKALLAGCGKRPF